MHLPRISLVVISLSLMVSGCVVQIDDKSVGGSDPCSPNPCEKQGVCSAWTATCTVTDDKAVCSGWKATDGSPGDAPAAYEAEETLCDGLDNDCDGLIDESPVLDVAKACPTVGVCTGQAATANCVAGAWQCSFAAVKDWEAKETSCDGKDNDCDGDTDEDVVASPKACKSAGVCSGLKAPTCAAGAWDCHYTEAVDYEATEQSCDGKDNDCDGIADANLTVGALPGGGKCADSGVCADGVSIICRGGVPSCDYQSVKDWEAVETKCDGKDNDCDGVQDNLQGSKQPLRNSDTKDCAKVGVCQTATSSQVSRSCQAGKWACDYSLVPYYEAQETLCDGRDNDCDGTADVGLKAPATSPCGASGVCTAGKPMCTQGLWTCDWGALAKEGYEAFEQTCDGKDNDCDGKTDEDPSPKASGCKAVGACSYGTAVTCKDGKATCDYSYVLAYEAKELSCDGKDNDCDGKTDEVADLDESKSGCSVGVCKGKAKAACSAGKWSCSYAGVTDYESKELTCDGKDNDCDGETDEGLNDVVAAKCNTLGVCKNAVTASCTGGKYACSYTSSAFQNSETLCDGKDNDCDGQTDIGLCDAGSPCTVEAQCKTGGCTSVLGGTGNVCTPKANQCAQRSVAGVISYVDNGTVSCADDGSTQTCTNGAFGSPKACPTSAPACAAGKCQLCIPNQKTCDATKPADVVKCSADGKTQSKVETCSTGKCSGDGVCVVKTRISANVSNLGGTWPSVAALSTGGFVLTWVDAKPTANVVVARVYKADGTPIGAQFDVSADASKPGDSRPAVAALGTGFAIAWTTTGNASDIRLRRFDATGKPAAADEAVAKTTQGIQKDPVMLSIASGLVVAWTSESVDAASTGVVMQRYNTTGNKVGTETLVNAKTSAQANSEAGAENSPAIAHAAKGGYVIAWISVNAGTGSVWARAFDDKGASTSDVMPLSDTTANINQLSVAIASSGVGHAVWRQNNGANGWDVLALRFSAALKPVGNAAVVHATATGEQSLPAVTVAADGRMTMVWQSESKSDGYDLYVRDLLATGAWTAADSIVVTPTTGEQDQGRVLSFADGRLLFVWRARTNDITEKGKIEAEFR